jgi:hypothetical protein
MQLDAKTAALVLIDLQKGVLAMPVAPHPAAAVNETESSKADWRVPASWPAMARWAALLALSMFVSLIWGAAGLPAALLLGPMISGIVFGVNGLRLDVPRWPYL